MQKCVCAVQLCDNQHKKFAVGKRYIALWFNVKTAAKNSKDIY